MSDVPSSSEIMRAAVRRLSLCALIVGFAACGSSSPQVMPTQSANVTPHHVDEAGPRPKTAMTTAEPVSRSAAGTWDWIFRSTTQQGDLRIEQEEWHLQQDGARVFGYYNRQVVTLSSDQRPFRCNGMLAFVNNTRVRVAGELRQSSVELREVGVDADKNPCDDGQRNLTTYVGRLDGDSLVLMFQSGGGQHLLRRPANSNILPLVTGGEKKSAEEEVTTAAVDGVWDWQFRAVDPEGDLHVEHEEWHIVEKNSELTGYYERQLERRRSVGVFSCNNNAVIKSTTRYVVKGQRFGNKLTLTEVDYQAQPNPCENRARRLDTYQGTLLSDGQMILSWGGGQQTLRKRR